jgi:ABC-2 type transport system ATP-binding protein
MSISVQQLSKVYGEQHAVDHISFEVPAGQIVGFLGPNGAGKSTTMKILTCFIPPTSGKAAICGYDSMEQPLQVKRRVGYLPEHNPLYPDMYIKEYLEFAARMHAMKNFGPRVDEMIAVTGLGPEKKKKIGQLSKGYRQRVGLAQAMLHDPEVLILDEPTSGLDPNQLLEIRKLIKTLGEQKTVILSTHIMQEVQALCDRIIIINKGRIVADDSVSGLQAQSTAATIVKVSFKETASKERFLDIPGVAEVKRIDDHQFLIQYMGNGDIRELLFQFAVTHQLTLLNLQLEQQNLEDVFRQLTN